MVAIREFTDSQSHRVVAILGTSLADEALRKALEFRLRQSTVIEDVFKPTGGILSTINSKIQIGYLLGIFGKEERRALMGLAEIGSRFANKLTLQTFDDKDQRLLLSFNKLRLHEKYSRFPNAYAEGDSEHEVPQPRDRRETLIVNLQLLLVILMRDRDTHLPHSNQSKPRSRLAYPEDPSGSGQRKARN